MQLKKLIKNKINLKPKQQFVTIIGSDPSKGARSPILWNRAFSKLKIRMKMYPLDVKNVNLAKVMGILKHDDSFRAAAVTIPYKEKIIRHLDIIDQTAKEIGSVNLIVKDGEKLKGYNTDSLGCESTLKKIKNKIKKILIIGCGGAGKACVVTAKNKYPKAKIYIFNRNLSKLKKFTKKIKTNKKNIEILKNNSDLKKINNLNLIINATSLGFDLELKSIKSNLKYFSPISYGGIDIERVKTTDDLNLLLLRNIIDTMDLLKRNSRTSIFDIIYKPSETVLMNIGKNLGLKTFNGLEMNFMQAVEAFKITNKNIKIAKIKKVMR